MEGKDTEEKSISRKEYYTRKVREAWDGYPNTYREFVKNSDVLKLVDDLLFNEISTGCNIATSKEFPVNSNDSLIFYGVYKQRANHFGEILSEMEAREIIEEDDVTFGIRSTKVFGDWSDEECVQGEIITISGKKMETRESVEGILIFQVKPEKVEDVVVYLIGEAPKLDGGYLIPDVRATATDETKRLLTGDNGLKIAKANVFGFKNTDSQLSTLTPEAITQFSKMIPDVFDSLLNPELYEFISLK